MDRDREKSDNLIRQQTQQLEETGNDYNTKMGENYHEIQRLDKEIRILRDHLQQRKG